MSPWTFFTIIVLQKNYFKVLLIQQLLLSAGAALSKIGLKEPNNRRKILLE